MTNELTKTLRRGSKAISTSLTRKRVTPGKVAAAGIAIAGAVGVVTAMRALKKRRMNGVAGQVGVSENGVSHPEGEGQRPAETFASH